MTVDEKQKELDLAKWNKSVNLRFDACGTFNYCASCNKNLNNPCAHAFGKYFNEDLEGANYEASVEKKETKKTTTKKATATKSTTKTCKSKTTAKTPSKKTTSTKKTTKSSK